VDHIRSKEKEKECEVLKQQRIHELVDQLSMKIRKIKLKASSSCSLLSRANLIWFH
jgi:hypothetical protein